MQHYDENSAFCVCSKIANIEIRKNIVLPNVDELHLSV
jgi:hypothetical protein